MKLDKLSLIGMALFITAHLYVYGMEMNDRTPARSNQANYDAQEEKSPLGKLMGDMKRTLILTIASSGGLSQAIKDLWKLHSWRPYQLLMDDPAVTDAILEFLVPFNKQKSKALVAALLGTPGAKEWLKRYCVMNNNTHPNQAEQALLITLKAGDKLGAQILIQAGALQGNPGRIAFQDDLLMRSASLDLDDAYKILRAERACTIKKLLNVRLKKQQSPAGNAFLLAAKIGTPDCLAWMQSKLKLPKDDSEQRGEAHNAHFFCDFALNELIRAERKDGIQFMRNAGHNIEAALYGANDQDQIIRALRLGMPEALDLLNQWPAKKKFSALVAASDKEISLDLALATLNDMLKSHRSISTESLNKVVALFPEHLHTKIKRILRDMEQTIGYEELLNSAMAKIEQTRSITSPEETDCDKDQWK